MEAGCRKEECVISEMHESHSQVTLIADSTISGLFIAIVKWARVIKQLQP